MSHLFKYSVIRYVPDELREEFINIGIIFHSPELEFVDLKFTTNFKRVSTFDDEIDINFLKIILQGIKESLTRSTVSGPAKEELTDYNFIETNTMYYANQIQFSPTQSFVTDDYERDLNDLLRTYVYFDVKGKPRITEKEVKVLMNKVLRTKDVYNNMDRNIKIDIGPQEVELDYAYKSKDRIKIIKTFSFDYTQRGSIQAPTVAKEWVYNFEKIISGKKYENFGVGRDKFDLVTFIYTGNTENKNTNTAISILNELTNTVLGRAEKEIEDFAENISKEIEPMK